VTFAAIGDDHLRRDQQIMLDGPLRVRERAPAANRPDSSVPAEIQCPPSSVGLQP
jgi:hypothetical protein